MTNKQYKTLQAHDEVSGLIISEQLILDKFNIAINRQFAQNFSIEQL